jgi:spore maturation protein CgeB
MLRERGEATLERFREVYPQLEGRQYDPENIDLDRVLREADLVLVHEWSEPKLVRAIGEHHKRHPGYRLLFHDTHHRSVTEPEWRHESSGFDGVLAYGRKIRNIYLASGWTRKAWVWHEAADVRVFHPQPPCRPEGDLVWIGNWGDDERSDEIREFLIEPVLKLGLKARVYGVGYPVQALRELSQAGIDYGGWLPNFDVPKVFARFRTTIHIPRRPYATALPGIPTICPFEALACGIPLISAPWEDIDGLFSLGEDYLVARDGTEMAQALRTLLNDPVRARQMAQRGCRTIAQRHTCAHRVNELLRIYQEIGCASDATTAG